MEHQLKLHIESVEDRIEELERDLDKKDKLMQAQKKDPDQMSVKDTIQNQETDISRSL